MFKLYDMRARDLVVANENEGIIANTLKNQYKQDDEYMIIERVNKGDKIVMGIKNFGDLEIYLNKFKKKRLEEMTCVELKRDMMDLVFSESKTKMR